MLVLALLLLVACGRANNGTYKEEIYDTPEETPIYAPEPYDSHLYDVFTSGRTRGEYLCDLDFLYNILRKNYPFFGVILRSHGVDMHARYLEAREHIENRDDFLSDDYFSATLNNFFIRPARGIGHLSTIPRDCQLGVLQFLQVLSYSIEQGMVELQPFLDELNNPATRALHNLTDADFIPPLQGVDSAVYATTSDNIQTYVIEDGRIAYVNIMAMNDATMEIDRVTLLDFFQQIAGYDHLIIDLRLNGGGGGSYFLDLVMSPNIAYPLYYNNYIFLTGGEHSRNMLSPWLGPITRAIDFDILERFPYFHSNDIDMLNYYIYSSIYIEPSHGSGIFGGKVWLLVSPHTFSAAAYAAAVVKQTGFATLVGQPTGGGGLGITPLLLALPNTGIVLRYAAGYGVDYLGRENYEHGIHPHYRNRPGMDALETALAMIEDGNY